MITYDDFKKIELKVGKIVSADKIPDTDKLLKLVVDMKEENPRQIVSGIALYYPEPEALVGKKVMFVANLEPRMIRGYESQGMILGLGGGDVPFSLLTPMNDEVEEGTVAN